MSDGTPEQNDKDPPPGSKRERGPVVIHVHTRIAEGGGGSGDDEDGAQQPHRHITPGFDETKLGMREVLPARFSMTVEEYGWAILDTEPDRTPILLGGFTRSAKSHRRTTRELLAGTLFGDESPPRGTTAAGEAEARKAKKAAAAEQQQKKKQKSVSSSTRSDKRRDGRKGREEKPKAKSKKRHDSRSHHHHHHHHHRKKRKYDDSDDDDDDDSSSSLASYSRSSTSSHSASTGSYWSSASSTSAFSESANSQSASGTTSEAAAAEEAESQADSPEEASQGAEAAALLPCVLSAECQAALQQCSSCMPPRFPSAQRGYDDLLAMSRGLTKEDFAPASPSLAHCSAPGCTQCSCCVDFNSGAPLCGSTECFQRLRAAQQKQQQQQGQLST